MPTQTPAGQPASDASQRTRPRRADAALAVGCLLLSLSVTGRFLVDLPLARALPMAGLVVAHSGLLAVLRPAPVLVHALAMAAGVGVVVLGLPSVVLALTPLAAMYLVATAAGLRGASFALALGLGWTALVSAGLEDMSTSTTASNAVAMSVAWTVGRLAAQRSANIDALRQRAAALEQARTALAERAVAEERLRIARELHDIVAHGLGVITIQAGVAAHVDLPPEEARRTLASIEQVSRQATEEMRRVLAVLRRDGDTSAERQPLPGEGDLPVLLRSFDEAGLGVDLEVHGEPGPLSAGTGLAVHRLVQEALTNVLKHAGTSKARVRLLWQDDEVVVEVEDDGGAIRPDPARSTSTQPPVEGHGLVGMRERVATAGGTLLVGPRSDGPGFRVRAHLPRAVTPPEPGGPVPASTEVDR